MQTTIPLSKNEILPLKDIYVLLSITTIVFILKAMWSYFFMSGPTCFADELLYRHNAFSIFELKKYYNWSYPPAYPLSLVPGLFFNNWYAAMGVMNSFWSSLLIPATWLLGRTVGLRNPISAAFLVSLIPMHAIFPHYILSENLFVPLFVMTVGLALRGGKGGVLEACVFGIVLGLTHLTKYLFLPAVPLLFIAWYMSHRQVCTISSPNRNQSKRILSIGATSYLIVMGIWAIYAFISGFSFSQMLGLTISGIKSESVSAASLIMWTTAYASYLVLVLYPALIAVMLWLTQMNQVEMKFIYNSKNKLHFIILTLFLVGGYWLLAIQHSFGATYNYPKPQYLIGRYLMHLIPLIIVLSLLCIERLENSHRKINFIKAFAGLTLLGITMVASWWILFRQGIWEFPRAFAKIAFNSVGINQSDSLSFLVMAGALAFVVFAALLFYPKKIYRIFIMIIALFLFQDTMLNVWRMKDGHAGRHAREMSSVLPLGDNDENLVFLDLPWISNRSYGFGLEFFGVPQKTIKTKKITDDKFTSKPGQFFIVTETMFDAVKPLHTYSFGEKTYRIYCFNEQNIDKVRPQIISYGPKQITAGGNFNVQPSGNSALWMKVSSVSLQGTICWDETMLSTSHGHDGFISAIVPDELVSKIYTATLRVYDPFTGLSSLPVDFSVTQ